MSGDKMMLAYAPADDGDDRTLTFVQGGKSRALSPVIRENVRHFELPINCGLESSYRIGDEGRAVTIPARPCGTGKALRLLFGTDFHAQRGRGMLLRFHGAIANLIATHQPDYFLLGGDLVEDDRKIDDWENFFSGFSPSLSTVPMVPAVGNNDFGPRWERFFGRPASDQFFKLDLPGVRIIVVNTNFSKDGRLFDAQKTVLPAWLSRPDVWKIVVMHHSPVAGAKSKGGGRVKPLKADAQFALDHLAPLLAGKADVVLSGDNHIFQAAKQDGVYYLPGGPLGGDRKDLVGFLPHPDNIPYGDAPVFGSDATLTWLEATPERLKVSITLTSGAEIFSVNLQRENAETIAVNCPHEIVN